MKFIIRNLAIAAVLAIGAPAFSQSLQSVSQAKDWTVFVDENNAKHCYVVSTPKSSAAYRGGSTVSVNRGDIRLYIGVKNGAPEPAFMAGYPLSAENNPTLKIGDKVFNFFINTQVDNQFAWPDPKRDQEIIAAMKAGTAAEMTGTSARGTTTVDQFSLSGFTAAFDAAVATCN